MHLGARESEILGQFHMFAASYIFVINYYAGDLELRMLLIRKLIASSCEAAKLD